MEVVTFAANHRLKTKVDECGETVIAGTYGQIYEYSDGEMGVLFHMPRSATARARTDATVIGYTAQAFRERLGAGGVRDLIGHRELADD